MADPTSRGCVFGVHRAMDHAGAVAGPLLASAFLWASPGDYRTLFLLTIVPGVAAVLMLLPVREAAEPAARSMGTPADPGSTPGGTQRSPEWGAPAAFHTGAGLAVLAAGLLTRVGLPTRIR